MQNQSKVSVISQKYASDWLLEQDKQSEEIIIAKIRETFPDHSIIAEESGTTPKDKKYTWMIDPLDGSFNYQHGIPLWGVIIGFCIDDIMKVAIIYLPLFDEMYTAIDKKGAYLNGAKIHVSTITELKKSVVVVGDYNKNNNQAILQLQLADMKVLSDNVGRVRMVGSSALDQAFIAAGKAECLINRNRGGNPWDIEIGKKLIEEAGGCVTSRVYEFGGLHIFSNKAMHQKFITLITS